ncbi:hypothetical protein C2845_PM05G15270 [Panicum miliaceum]|uniref:RNase H type-1 domain-containing protein n=1 Tax=Panicum miliaceum TaxID=4540 RepID=A0A3L6SXB7_PANMI|nr:hypothetical protein C2845_PM05G15270 [Panicum miliaceum]
MEPSQLACIIWKNTDEFPTIGNVCTAIEPRSRKKWERPGKDVLKINCDGAFRSETSVGGWGFVIRDSAGLVIRSGAGSCLHLMDALHAELLACLAGVRAAGEMGMSNVIIEIDSMLARLTLSTTTFALAPVGGIVYEIKYLMNLFFTSVNVAFFPRECNRVAHAVAALGSKCPPGAVLSWDGTPSGIEDLVTSDLTVSLV